MENQLTVLKKNVEKWGLNILCVCFLCACGATSQLTQFSERKVNAHFYEKYLPVEHEYALNFRSNESLVEKVGAKLYTIDEEEERIKGSYVIPYEFRASQYIKSQDYIPGVNPRSQRTGLRNYMPGTFTEHFTYPLIGGAMLHLNSSYTKDRPMVESGKIISYLRANNRSEIANYAYEDYNFWNIYGHQYRMYLMNNRMSMDLIANSSRTTKPFIHDHNEAHYFDKSEGSGYIFAGSGNTIVGFNPIEGVVTIKKLFTSEGFNNGPAEFINIGDISDHYGTGFASADDPHSTYTVSKLMTLSSTSQFTFGDDIYNDFIINRYMTISPDGNYAALVRGDRFLEIYLVNLKNQEITKAYHFGEKQIKEPYADRLKKLHAWQNKYDISGSFFDENNNFILIDHINGLYQVYNPGSKINPVNVAEIDNELLQTKKRAAIRTEITHANRYLGKIGQKNYTIQFDVNESESRPFVRAHFTDYETGEIFYSERLYLESRTGQYPNFDAVNVIYNPFSAKIYVWHNDTEHYPEMVYYDYGKVLDLTFPSAIKWMKENEIYDLFEKRERLNPNAVTSLITFYYEGEMRNGAAHGMGNAVSENGEIVIKNGIFEEGKLLEGTAFWVDRRYIFAGEFGDKIVKRSTFDNIFGDEIIYYYPALNGIGMYVDTKGNASKGEFVNSALNGKGEVNTVSGNMKRGEFKDSQLHGEGELLEADGDKWMAVYKEGKPDGRATLVTSDGLEKTITFNSSGERTDREYLNKINDHNRKQEELVREFRKVYDVEYQAIKDQKENVNNLINSLAFGAAMGGMASAMGADDVTAFEFGVTAMSDSYNQTTTGLRDFNPSINSMSSLTNGPEGLLSDYKNLEAYTNSLDKAGSTISDAFGWDESESNTQVSEQLSQANTAYQQSQHSNNDSNSGNRNAGQNSGRTNYNAENELIGTWVAPGETSTVEFRTDGTGVMRMKNLNQRANCPQGSVYTFNWEITDGGKLYLIYTSGEICGEKQETPEPDDPKTFQISGNSLAWANVNWTRS